MSLDTNPFDQSYESQVSLDCNNELPLTLDRFNNDGSNTPISRFSAHTNHSEIVCEKQNSLAMKKVNMPPEMDVQIKAYIEVIEKRNEELAIALERQKVKNNHIEQAFNLIKKEDFNLLTKYQEMNERNIYLQNQTERLENLNEEMISKFEQNKAQVNYLKQLILLANNNYESLEQKYQALLERNRKVEEQQIQKEKEMSSNVLEMKNILTNIINNPAVHENQSQSNSENKRSGFASLKSPKRDTDEVYRKLFLKTLKVKK